MYEEVIRALWFIFPAYVANSMAINTSGIPLLRRYSVPIDFGRKWRGREIFGRGKTWRGFVSGVLSGTVVGYLQLTYSYSLPVQLPPMTLSLAFLISLGAMMGDLTASFLKRRSGFERGAPIPIIDQLDYIAGAFLFAWLLVPADVRMLMLVALITIPVHIISNVVAWLLKLKKVPW